MQQEFNKVFFAGVLSAWLGCVGVAAVCVAQEQPASDVGGEESASAEDRAGTISFNFKDTPFDQVLDYFSRATGLPIITEAGAPKASMTFLSTEEYSLERALTILNLNLHMHGVHLRRDGDFFYLSSITDAVRKAGKAYQGAVPSDVPPDEIVTVTIPLQRTNVTDMAEKVRAMVGEYGAVVPVEGQNVLVVVETAGQIERIQALIGWLDDIKRLDEEYRVFTLKNARGRA